jgi:hypothetical protein
VLVAAALAVGVVVGFISGLTGIGGGVLMVPFLYLLYGRLGVDAEAATVLAHATSLMVIVPAAIRGLLGYRGSGLVHWRAAVPIAIAAAAAAAATAPLVTHLPGRGLRIGFGAFLLLIAADLLLRRSDHARVPPARAGLTALAVLLGVPVGALSAALGVGGGVPATMLMHYAFRLPFRLLAPTSLVVIAVTAAAGSLSYALTPAGPVSLPAVVGHVDLGHGLPLAVGAVAAAPLGVYVNKRAPVATLRRIFGALLLAIGVTLLLENA